MARINNCLPADDRVRMRALLKKRDDEAITAVEWRELAALTELAEMRGVTLDDVMNRLGIQLPMD